MRLTNNSSGDEGWLNPNHVIGWASAISCGHEATQVLIVGREPVWVREKPLVVEAEFNAAMRDEPVITSQAPP